MSGIPVSARLLELNKTHSAVFIKSTGVLRKNGELEPQTNFKFPAANDWMVTSQLPENLKSSLQSMAGDLKVARGLAKISVSESEVIWEILHHLIPNKSWQKAWADFQEFKKATNIEMKNVSGILKKLKTLPPRLETLEFWVAMMGTGRSKEPDDKELIFRRGQMPAKISGRYRRLIKTFRQSVFDIDRVLKDLKFGNPSSLAQQPSLKKIFLLNLNWLLNMRSSSKNKIHSSLVSNILSHFDGYGIAPGNVTRFLKSA